MSFTDLWLWALVQDGWVGDVQLLLRQNDVLGRQVRVIVKSHWPLIREAQEAAPVVQHRGQHGDGRNDAPDKGRDGRNDAPDKGRDGRNDAQGKGRDGRNDASDKGRNGRNDAQDKGRDGRNDAQDKGRDERNDAQDKGQNALRTLPSCLLFLCVFDFFVFSLIWILSVFTCSLPWQLFHKTIY